MNVKLIRLDYLISKSVHPGRKEDKFEIHMCFLGSKEDLLYPEQDLCMCPIYLTLGNHTIGELHVRTSEMLLVCYQSPHWLYPPSQQIPHIAFGDINV